MDRLDSETLRWLLAVIGAFLIAGVYIWGRYKEKLLDFINQRGEYDELGLDQETLAGEELTPTKVTQRGGSNTGRIEPPMSFDALADDEDLPEKEWPTPASVQEPTESAARESSRTASLGAPFLIQISVVARENRYFDGLELRDALDDSRLIYGDMGIYHRYDRDYRVPLFSVASLVEPGTFPIKDMKNFHCPGVVLFFQPPQVDDPLAVFDDLVTTCHELAMRLDGVEWDEQRQPLTQEKIALMRSRLREAS